MKGIGKMTGVRSVILVIACFIIGSIFIFGDRYLNAPVSRDEAIHKSVVFSSYEEVKLRRRSPKIIMRFEDHMQLEIGGVYLSDELRKDIGDLDPGTELGLMIHPNSNMIMEMRAGEKTLIDFDESSRVLASRAGSFLWPGIICYIASGAGVVRLLISKRK